MNSRPRSPLRRHARIKPASKGRLTPRSKVESASEKRTLTAREAEVIYRTRARLDARKGISGVELAVWLDTYELSDGILPVPKIRADRLTSR